MADLVVLAPSRGRPGAAQALIQHFKNTCTADTRLTFVLDRSDPTREDYPADAWVITGDSRNMVEALNLGARSLIGNPIAPAPFAIGFMGDDHMPRTLGWDQSYLDALRDMGTGIVYGNDLLQGSRLPTQCAMTSDIVQALGYMAPPELVHMYVDNTWLRWGKGVDRLRYLPDVIVEHRHPLAGKAVWDDGYERVNKGEIPARDRQAFDQYVRSRLDEDLAKLKALL